MSPSPTCLVVINLACGRCAGEATVNEVRQLLEDHSLRADLRAVEPPELAAVLEEGLPAKPALVVAGGGDGTLRTVAAALLDTPHTLGVLPLGTINHLARDLEIPLDLPSAVATLGDGEDRSIDVGEVNGELFLNACALGVYAELVRMHARRRRRHPHWPAVLRWLADTSVSLWRVVRSWRLVRLRLHIEGRSIDRRVPLLVIANNPLPPLTGSRRLDRGRLAVYVPRAGGPSAVAAALLRAVVRGPERVEGLAVHHAPRAVVEVSPGTRVVVDGESLALEPPLEVRSRPQSLTVRVPKGADVGSAGAGLPA